VTPDRETLANPRLWLAFASMLLVSGLGNTFPIFFPALLAEFGGSRGATASTVSFLWIGGAVLGPLSGYLIARRNPRLVVICGLGAAAAGLSVGTLATSLPMFIGAVGIGGGIVMAPALLYLPPAFGLASLDMRQVAGLTITQGLFACLSGAWRHDRHRSVSRRLVISMGSAITAAALAGSVISRWVANEVLMVVFAGLAAIAALMMWLPMSDEFAAEDPNACSFNIPLAVSIALAIGFLGGLVGQGGSFILIPLMLYVLRLPTRVVIGSNLALVFLASLAGFVGKAATGRCPCSPPCCSCSRRYRERRSAASSVIAPAPDG